MLRSMYSAISGMKAEQTKLDVVANNIANVSTTAFKTSKVNFSDTLYQSMSSASAPGTNLGGVNGKSVGLGARVSSINKLMSNGNSLTTGRTLDLDVDGNGYLVVTKGTTSGAINLNSSDNTIASANTNVSQTLFTRNGNLSLDENGNLVTSDGYRVMGYYATADSNGGAVTEQPNSTTGVLEITGTANPDYTITYGTTLQPLAIPNSIKDSSGNSVTIQSISIGQDGVITATLSGGTKTVLGQVAMANFKNPEGLEDLGNSYQNASTSSGPAIIRTSATPTSGATDNSGAYGKIQSGYLEASNVDLTEQFTDMITATRAFQAASKMISNGDEILQTITGLVR
ncbi:flagellar hook-basal body complex protein [Clostridium sp.]|uniref:flagellar hook-basal body complex protein n=1 Tax=Clostridium sp. TaxID=1506 RepID=UPI002638C6E9|nr:flagellar hook-basal body complex protein [Clostridium sp.]